MTYTLEIGASARVDFLEAMEWYGSIREELAVDFLFNLEHALDNILRSPLAYPMIHGNVRRAILKRFPYGVFYSIRGTAIVVVSLFHTSRSPSIWQARQ